MTDTSNMVVPQEIKAVRSNCTAFSWDADGRCLGIRLECAADGKLRIAALWSDELKSHEQNVKGAIAETLSEGRRALDVNDTSYCIASPMGSGWGMSDLDMPLLKGQELRAALAFELRKRTPIPTEQLEWGYRLLDTASAASKRLRVRLFYVKKDVWRKWRSAVTGLSKVDILAPAPVLLDPLFSDITVGFYGKTCFEYVPCENGREAVPCEPGGASLASALPLKQLDSGELVNLPESEQLRFVPAIVAAAYGLTRALGQDGRTLPELPQELRPRRYQACKIIASILCAFILICLCYGFMQGYQQRKIRLGLVQKDIKTVEAEIKSLRNASNSKYAEAAKLLEEEMKRYKMDAPSLSEVLVELTKQTKSPAWFAGPFTWTMDINDSVVPVTFVLREPLGDNSNLDLGTRLNNSPILGDVVENKSSNNRAGYLERRFVLKARYDTSEEKRALEEYLRNQKEGEAKKAKSEMDVQATGAAGEATQGE